MNSRRALTESVAVLPALVLGAFAWAPALARYFASDDVTFLRQAVGLEPAPHSPLRWLSGAPAWRLLHSMFGLDPLPWHALLLGLHAVASVLVHTIARRLGSGATGAGIAALLFATSPLAFTPLHWASGLPELLAAVFALGAAAAFLAALDRRSIALATLALPLWLLALSAKESVLLLPFALAVPTLRPGPAGWPRRVRPWLLVAGVAGVVAFAFLATRAGILGGDAYATTFAPRHLLANLATDLAWTVHAGGPIPDRVASADPRLWPIGVAVGIAVVALPWLLCRTAGQAAGFGGVWFLALLLPVLPLARHSYAYYLYLPGAGACWYVVAIARDVGARRPGLARIVLAALTVLALGVSLRDIRARASLRANGLPLDPTVRSSLLLRNGIEGLRAAKLEPPDSVVFLAPFRTVFQDLAAHDATLRSSPSGARVYSPFEAALRGGDAVPVFLPGVRVLGFGERILPEWEQAAVFVFANDGQLTPLGRGLDALRASGAVMLQSERWDLAEPTFRRAIALGDSTADVAHGLLHSLAGLGREREAGVLARAFVRRWPDDPRAEPLRAWLATPR